MEKAERMKDWKTQITAKSLKARLKTRYFPGEDEKKNILSLGEGQGRNACYLAQLGHSITATDASSVGMTKTMRLADQLQVTEHIRTVITDLREPGLSILNGTNKNVPLQNTILQTGEWVIFFSSTQRHKPFPMSFFLLHVLPLTSLNFKNRGKCHTQLVF